MAFTTRLAAALAFLSMGFGAAHAQGGSIEARIGDLAMAEIEASGVPSLQIAVGRGGTILFEGAFGLADLENAVLATPESRYRTASLSKWFSATAAMRLAEQGRLDIDAPVQKYCPQYPQKPWPVTSRQLMNHTAGVRNYRDYAREMAKAATEADRQRIARERDRAAVSWTTRYANVIDPIGVFANEPLEFQPGTAHRYTSFGYRVLGCVIVGAAGRPYSDVLQEEIFAPLGMESTRGDDQWEIIPGRVGLYQYDRGAVRRADYRDVSENLAGGGHLSTAGDLVSFGMAFQEGRLVSKDTRALMETPSQVSQRDSPYAPYGLGVKTYTFAGETVLGHDGTQQGATTILVYAPKDGTTIAILANAFGWPWANMQGLAEKLIAIAREPAPES
jgi:serine beta-lactamase-like protein LACTB, mitochondrial